MPRKIASTEDVRTRWAELSGWQTATRNDGAVAKTLQATRAMDQISPLREAAFFDERFPSIREIGAWDLLEALDPKAREGAASPCIQCGLLTLMRCVGGVQSLRATQAVLATAAARMGVLGFNAAQVQHGRNDRGVRRRTQPVEIRGAFAFETVADNLGKIGPARLAELFNGAIRCLAKPGMCPKRSDAVRDATDAEATPTDTTDAADGEGPCVSRAKRPDGRANTHAKKIQVTVCGWKLGSVCEPVAQIPLALAIEGINGSDTAHAYAGLDQARRNVAGSAVIRSVARDRGCLDGDRLSRIDPAAVVSIPAQSTLTIPGDAREIARRAEALAAPGKALDGCMYQERIDRVPPGSGKTTPGEERKTSGGRIRDLPCDGWKPGGSTSAANAKRVEPKRGNATGVLRGDGAPKDADQAVVIRDTDPAADPFVGFDADAERRLSENPGNREAQASGLLEPHPQRSAAGVRVQADFVCLGLAGVTAFRLSPQQVEEAESRGEDPGIGRSRRQLEAANRDQGIVFCGEPFGIFRHYAVLRRVGVSVRARSWMGGSTQAVLDRCRARPQTTA